MKIGLMTPGLANFDAVSNDVAEMYTIFRALGFKVYIFTQNGETTTSLPVFHYRDSAVLLTEPDDIVIYHYCIYDPSALQSLRRLKVRVVIRYHNVTPPELMGNYSLDHSRACALGRRGLRDLINLNVSGFLSASAFNQQDLINLGIDRTECRVVPPFHRVEHLLMTSSDVGAEQVLDRAAINLLSVGRMVPNKGHKAMIEAFSRVAKNSPVRINLHLIGGHDPRLSNYMHELRNLKESLAVDGLVFHHPKINDKGLATFYRGSDLYWTMSYHEGFCVPLIEAMAFGLPIVATSFGAIPETLGQMAGNTVDTVEEAADEVLRLLSDDSLRFKLNLGGREEYKVRFAPAVIAGQFLAALGSLLGLGRELGLQEAVTFRQPHTSIEADWFGMPLADKIIPRALALPGAPQARVRWPIDAQRDFLDWMFRCGVGQDTELAEFVASSIFNIFMQKLPVPIDGSVLDGPQRLTWAFHGKAHWAFDLQSRASVVEFLRWYEREGRTLYNI